MAEGSCDPSTPGLVQTLDTELYADSVEWCPHKGCQDVLVCGTYQLEEDKKTEASEESTEPQTRVGQLRVYRLGSRSKEAHDTNRVLSLHHCLPMAGILDIKWCNHSDGHPVLGLVNAKGELQIWQVTDLDRESPPGKITEVELEPSCLGLSLDWSAEGEGKQIVTSDSNGFLSLFDVHDDVTQVSKWHAHEYEAWICAHDRWNPGLIYSGGDDTLFKGWDMRVGTTPIFTNKRHNMGVCSIQSNRLQEYKLAVGRFGAFEEGGDICFYGYDEELHIWDTRNMKRPIAVCDLGGGIWRVKWDPFKGETILTATMYNGFHIVDAKDEKLSISSHYESEQYLGYGADWCYMEPSAGGQSDRESSLIATCSFYNHSLQLRQWPT